MNLKDEKNWNEYVKVNKDPYGGACVIVARRVMEILDKNEPFDTYKIVCQADEETRDNAPRLAGSITGAMAGMVACIVSECHERGEEFRKQWNLDNQIGGEGEKANEEEGVLNPALLSITTPEK